MMKTRDKLLLAALSVAIFGLGPAWGEVQVQSGTAPTKISKGVPLGSDKRKSTSESERRYWECILKNMKEVASDDAVPVIQAACRALNP